MMLEKNIQFLNNENLKSRLCKMNIHESCKNIAYCMTNSNDYLLMKNDVPIDDINNPREDIQKMLNENIKSEMGQNDIIITFGIGLCYMLDEVFNKYVSKIVVYEPDIDLLHFVLSNVDISTHLASGRVFISNRLNEVVNFVNQKYITKDKIEVVYLKNYAIVKNKELLELTQKIYEACNSKMIDVNTIKKFSKKWLINTLSNIYTINHGEIYNFLDLKNKFVGQTALIISAGPSLLENIENIKANRSKYVILAVNKVLRTLLQYEIIPDFVVSLDAQNINLSFNGLEDFCKSINCITDIKSDTFSYQNKFKRTFVGFSTNDFVTKKLSFYDKNIKLNEFGGSSTSMAMVAAIKMGFAKIIFVGLDMAFKDGVMYSTGEKVEKNSANSAIIHNVAKNIVKIPSVTGDMVETRDDYAGAIFHLESLIEDLDYKEIYNVTSFGAAIKGIKNVPFAHISLLVPSIGTGIILGEIKPFKLQVEQFAQEELNVINEVMMLLSKNGYSQMLVSTIVKSSLMYQYMQVDILHAIRTRFSEDYAEEFENNTKQAIKNIIDLIQKKILV